MLPNLGKYWGPPCLDNCIDRRDVCEGRHDNLISGLQVQAMQCHMQGRGPVTYGANVLRPDPRSYRSLEAIKELPARRNPGAIKSLHHVCALVARQIRLIDWQEAFAYCT